MDQRRCHDLRVEHLHAPLAVATSVPRFSWLVEHEQTAYRLTVRTPGGELVWDSGRTTSAATSLVPYAGTPLRSDTDHTWTVESWDAAGTCARGVSRFGTGLSAADWTAPWVEPVQDATVLERWSLQDWIRGAGPATAAEERLRSVQLLRQRIHLPESPVRGRLYATAHGVYQASLNGEPVGDEVLAPGSDSYRHRVSVQAYDVTAPLRAGENVLGIALADGWWAGRIGLTGSSAQFGDRTAATWQLHVELADGRRIVCGADGDVVSAPGPWRYADLFVGECFDARGAIPDWDGPSFDASTWTPVRVTDEPTTTLVPFAGEPVRRLHELPMCVLHDDGEGIVLDAGQVIAGRVRLRLSGLRAGQRVTIEHTETLAADGAWFVNIVGINKDQTDVYIAAGTGDETYEPVFTYHGFRYARIRGLDAGMRVDAAAVVIGSDLEPTGTFETSDPRLNRLHENVVWSQRGNFVSVPTDCPQREKVGWTSDAQVFAPAATNNARVASFFTRWLANLRADQLPDGAVPITSPRSPFDAEAAAAADGVGGIVSAAGWSDAIAFVPWTLYERYGDERVLAENIDAILAWIEWQQRAAASALPDALSGAPLSPEREARQRLLWNTGDQFGDWLAPSTMEGRPVHEAIGIAPALTGELVAPMFQAQTLTLAARMTAVLGRDAESAELAARARAVRAAFAAEYIDEYGDLPVRLQGVYTLALAFDMVPDELRASVADRLVELVHERGDRLDTGFLSVPYLLDVLCDTGHRDLARRLLWQSEMPSWMYEVDAGATTIWESWDAVAPDGTPRATSLNHYAFGCVDDWLYRRVLGIAPVRPGYRHVVIEPDLEIGVTFARGSVTTPYGAIGVDWALEGAGARVTCTVPHGVHAELRLGGRSIHLPPGSSTHHCAPVALQHN
ncbi:family 78 glycoside hydrolase catalytic domain [Microbacterium sp. KR10-403]|uniref:family 78 glycoside hydrolase catalytic domain n=1 Tax=Microbacterium sp. KR10-403 TaxID=3158581 RepID=UPI0032E4F74B